MPGNLAILRSQIEAACAERVSAPFAFRERKIVETATTGIAGIDALTGGLPRGGLTEISGLAGAGNMSLLVSLLAEQTAAQAEACALVDARDAFDPYAADAAGVDLRRLLWVRCGHIDQALRAADLVIAGGGFGLVALDLSDVAPEIVRQVPLNAWFRFGRAVEDTSTIFLVLDREPNTRSCASLALGLEMTETRWSMARDPGRAKTHTTHTPGCLLEGFELRAKILRARRQEGGRIFQFRADGQASREETGFFETSAGWNCPQAS
jgi:recombination protein RecA